MNNHKIHAQVQSITEALIITRVQTTGGEMEEHNKHKRKTSPGNDETDYSFDDNFFQPFWPQ